MELGVIDELTKREKDRRRGGRRKKESKRGAWRKNSTHREGSMLWLQETMDARSRSSSLNGRRGGDYPDTEKREEDKAVGRRDSIFSLRAKEEPRRPSRLSRGVGQPEGEMANQDEHR